MAEIQKALCNETEETVVNGKNNVMKPRSLSYFCLIFFVAFTAFQCKKASSSANCYKGRLEIQGICGNYTIKLLEGNLDKSSYETSWTDPQSGKTHTNVFALGNQCSFPASLKEGDEFYFDLPGSGNENCAVCLAIYPKPSKKLSIRVLDKPCN